MTAVLRVSGTLLDIDQCSQWLPVERVDLVWRRGERDRRGAVRDTSGFNLLLADGEPSNVLVQTAVREFLVIAVEVRALVHQGASAEIDFALFVVGGAPGSIHFPFELLAKIVCYDVGVTISAYPASDDDHEN